MGQRSLWMGFNTGLFQVVVVALCFVSRREQAQASTAWSPEGAVTVRKGDDLSVTCTVSGISEFFAVTRLVHTQGLKAPHPISDNDAVKAPYSELSRYNVTYRHTGSIAVLTLNYHGIQPEDAGTLGCQVLSGSADASSLLNITVLVPVSDICVVAISSDGSQACVKDEGGVSLEQNRPLGVGCVALVDGSAEAPEIRVAIDDKDETSLFTSTTNTSLVLLDSGLSLFKSERKMIFMTSRPDPDFNDKTIKCSVIGYTEQNFATAVLSVKFAPVVDCHEIELEAMVGDQVTVTCDAKANPSSRAIWKWSCESEDKLTEQDNIAFNKSAISKYQSRLEMTVTQIKDSQFCIYFLMVENEIGTTNVTLELIKVAGPVGNQSLNPEVVSKTKHSNLEALPPKQDPVIHEPQNGVTSQFQFSVFHFLCQLTIVISTFYLL